MWYQCCNMKALRDCKQCPRQVQLAARASGLYSSSDEPNKSAMRAFFTSGSSSPSSATSSNSRSCSNTLSGQRFFAKDYLLISCLLSQSVHSYNKCQQPLVLLCICQVCQGAAGQARDSRGCIYMSRHRKLLSFCPREGTHHLRLKGSFSLSARPLLQAPSSCWSVPHRDSSSIKACTP